ncbi:MAG: hypothetical protein Q9196_004225 [Gyalolechia fulgens]
MSTNSSTSMYSLSYPSASSPTASPDVHIRPSSPLSIPSLYLPSPAYSDDTTLFQPHLPLAAIPPFSLSSPSSPSPRTTPSLTPDNGTLSPVSEDELGSVQPRGRDPARRDVQPTPYREAMVYPPATPGQLTEGANASNSSRPRLSPTMASPTLSTGTVGILPDTTTAAAPGEGARAAYEGPAKPRVKIGVWWRLWYGCCGGEGIE